jgi:hypothetical protein
MRLVDADQFDELVEIVDALADVIKCTIDRREPLSQAADSIAARARCLYQKRGQNETRDD